MSLRTFLIHSCDIYRQTVAVAADGECVETTPGTATYSSVPCQIDGAAPWRFAQEDGGGHRGTHNLICEATVDLQEHDLILSGTRWYRVVSVEKPDDDHIEAVLDARR